jgi:restriction endonuclease Mrr
MKYQRVNIKNYLIPVLALVFLASVTYGAGQALADDPDQFPPFVQRLVEKFNLNESEVGEVLEEFRGEHHLRMQERMGSRLSQLVIEGEITEVQKQAILDKHAEMQAEHEELMSRWPLMTEEERLAAHEAHRDQLKAWAEEQGLDLSEILGFGDGMGMRNHHFGRWDGR